MALYLKSLVEPAQRFYLFFDDLDTDFSGPHDTHGISVSTLMQATHTFDDDAVNIIRAQYFLRHDDTLNDNERGVIQALRAQIKEKYKASINPHEFVRALIIVAEDKARNEVATNEDLAFKEMMQPHEAKSADLNKALYGILTHLNDPLMAPEVILALLPSFKEDIKQYTKELDPEEITKVFQPGQEGDEFIVYMVDYLIKQGADAGATFRGKPLLYWAAFLSHKSYAVLEHLRQTSGMELQGLHNYIDQLKKEIDSYGDYVDGSAAKNLEYLENKLDALNGILSQVQKQKCMDYAPSASACVKDDADANKAPSPSHALEVAEVVQQEVVVAGSCWCCTESCTLQ